MMEMMQGKMMGANGAVMSETDASMTSAAAVTTMAASMMEVTQNAEPGVGFVQALIAQRNGSVALAEAVLQYGADDQVKSWANEVLAAAPADIARWQDWLDSQPN
ncbi:DUF305 domain-containing protein [Paracoccus sp. 08]|uniref:DUF305 domain-containing protein n=1 Tax=Paracoccus sp. 08 TaxID=2606624 RepID=UPI002095E584|nr:DUF305 domain-containing protein [Paracoccus sp. 08]MCO6363380.1 DUF305 domain-containing protein [Paracoccus sp. 08]